MSDALPKAKMSAYQRWEMSSFDTPEQTLAPLPVVIPLELPTQESIDRIKEAARLDGFAEGLEAGRLQGIAAGQAQVRQEIEALQLIAQSFSTEVIKADQAIADDVLLLSLDMAKSVLKTALTIRPELVLSIVRDAIHILPSVQQPAILFLHPIDAALIHAHLTDELNKSGWVVQEDKCLSQGGCRVETGTNQVDATIEARWTRLSNALGSVSGWLV